MKRNIAVLFTIMLLMVTSSSILGIGNENDQKSMNEIKYHVNPLNPITGQTQNDPIEIYEGEYYQTWITVSWDPPDPQRPICLWANSNTLPDGATLTPECNCYYGQVSSLFEWTPSMGQAGTYYIEFEVGEACWQKIGSFTLTIIVKPVLTPSINIDKWVSIDSGITWSKYDEAFVCTVVRFRMVVENDGDVDLTNIKVTDSLPNHLDYKNNADPFEPIISGDTLTWLFPESLKANETITIEFDAHVREEGNDENEVMVTADYDDGTVSDYDTAVLTGLDKAYTIKAVIKPKTGLGITAQIINTGEETFEEELSCKINVKTRFLLKGEETNVQLSQPIQPGETIEVQTQNVLGFGFIEITVWVFSDDELIALDTAEGFLGGPLVFFDNPLPYHVGVDWINDYDDVKDLAYAMSGLWIDNLGYTDDNTRGFYDVITDEPTWELGFEHGDEGTKAVAAWHRKGTDDLTLLVGNGVDCVDFMYHSGHGCGYTNLGWGSCYIFGRSDIHGDWYLESTPRNRMAEWGNSDLEWIVLDVCSALSLKDDFPDLVDYTIPERWANSDVMHGLHYIFGFATIASDAGYKGRAYAYYLTGQMDDGITYDVSTAWQKATEDTESDYEVGEPFNLHGVVKGAYIRAISPIIIDSLFINDKEYIWGRGDTGPDPDPETQVYIYLNWPCD